MSPRGKKLAKDANAPKRALSAYFTWLQAERPKLKASNPELKGPAAVKVLGERWAKTTDDVKAPFIKEAEVAKRKYAIAWAAYQKTPEFAKYQEEKATFKASGKGTGKKPKDTNAPKRAMSAYFLWLNDNRPAITAANPGLAPPKIVKIAGEKWASLSEEEKKPYAEKAAAAKVTYQEKLAAYQKTPEYAAYQEQLTEFHDSKKRSRSASKGKTGSAKKKAKKADPNAPKKPPSAFEHFATQERPAIMEANPGISYTSATTQLRTRWRDMSKEDKAPFVEDANKCKDAYQKSVESSNGGHSA